MRKRRQKTGLLFLFELPLYQNRSDKDVITLFKREPD